MKAETTYTADDLGAIEMLIESPGWRLIHDRIRQMIETGRDALERQDNILVRGELKALRTVTSLPNIMRDEMTRDLKEANDGE